MAAGRVGDRVVGEGGWGGMYAWEVLEKRRAKRCWKMKIIGGWEEWPRGQYCFLEETQLIREADGAESLCLENN